MTTKNENYIKLYHTMDSGVTKHILIIQYKNEIKKYESDKPFLKMAKNKDTGEEFATLPIVHNSFNLPEDKLFYAREMQKIKEESVDIVYNTNQFLSVEDKKLNFFDTKTILKEINSKKEVKDFPLINFYLKSMFNENYDEFINFLSFRYKNPFINPKISFVLYGSNQIGKSTFITSLLSKIFGSFNVAPNLAINKNEDFHFNAKFINKIFTCIEEFNSNDKKIVETFKNLVIATTYDKNDKFKSEIHVPHFNTYIINTNHYPQWVEQQEKSRRFVVLSLNKQLFLENSNVEDFEAEIPAFINFINNLNPKKPIYEDFNKINTLFKYTNSENNIWTSVLSEFVDSRDCIKRIKDNETFLLINTKTMTAINAIYNDMQGNTGQNIENFNIKRFVSKIIDLKSDSITGVYQKAKKINGAVWNDYIVIKKPKEELPVEDGTIKQPVKEVKEEQPTQEVKEVKEELPVREVKEELPQEDTQELTIEDITNACKVLNNKNKEDLKAELNLDEDTFNKTKDSLFTMQKILEAKNIKVYNENTVVAEFLKRISRC